MSESKWQGRLAPFFLPIRGKLPLLLACNPSSIPQKSLDLLGVLLKEGKV
jgi:hypothetical protein